MLKDFDDGLLLEVSFLWTFYIVLKQSLKDKITKQSLKDKITTFRRLVVPGPLVGTSSINRTQRIRFITLLPPPPRIFQLMAKEEPAFEML
jgi:hypothetical protein